VKFKIMHFFFPVSCYLIIGPGISFLAMQVIFICVYVTNYLHFFTMFLSFQHFKTLKTVTWLKPILKIPTCFGPS